MTEIYRDPTEGAAARRQDLLRKRRDELVTMPHAVRRVVVARRARIAGSLALIAIGLPLTAAICSPALAARVASGLPGIAPAPLSTLLIATWLAGVGAYLLSRARAEHRFAVAMSRYVLPGADLAHDVERLSHEHPDEAARGMAHGLEVASATLPVLATALVVPASVLYVVMTGRVRAWPQTSEYEQALAGHAFDVLSAIAIGLVSGIAMTRRAMRMRAMPEIAGAVATLAAATAAGQHSWLALGFASTAATIAAVTWRLRVERAQIEAADPAAGSELFTLRGLWRRVCALAGAVRRTLTIANLRRAARVRPVVIAALICLAVTGVAYRVHVAHRGVAHAQPTARGAVPAAHAVETTDSSVSTFEVHRGTNGQILIDVALADHRPLEIGGLGDIATGWRGQVRLRVLSASAHGDFAVTAFPLDSNVAPVTMGALADDVVQAQAPCPMATSLGLRVTPMFEPAAGERVTFVLEPMLALSSCGL